MSILAWMRKRRLRNLDIAIAVQKRKVEVLSVAEKEYAHSYYTDKHIGACTQLVKLTLKHEQFSIKR